VPVRVEGSCVWVHLDDGSWIRLSLPRHEYEPEAGALLPRLLGITTKPAFLDCGANIGCWSVVGSLLLPIGRVLAVEASSGAYYQLEKNVSPNVGRFGSVHAAVWITGDEQLESVPADLGTRAILSSLPSRRTDGTGPVGDDRCLAQIIDPDTKCQLIIKLDVEGAEVEALRGARNTLATHSPVFVHDDPAQDPEHLSTRHLVEEIGYCICYGDLKGNLSVSEITEIKQDMYRGYLRLSMPPTPCCRDFELTVALVAGDLYLELFFTVGDCGRFLVRRPGALWSSLLIPTVHPLNKSRLDDSDVDTPLGRGRNDMSASYLALFGVASSVESSVGKRRHLVD